MTDFVAIAHFSNRVSFRRLITQSRALSLMGHVNAFIPPDTGLVEIRSPSQVVYIPTCIEFSIDRAFIPHIAKPTKRGVYERDHGACGYCGKRMTLDAATLDHIIPQSQGGPSTWENLVLACKRCNTRKADRSLKEAHMKLLVQPYIPKVRLRPE